MIGLHHIHRSRPTRSSFSRAETIGRSRPRRVTLMSGQGIEDQSTLQPGAAETVAISTSSWTFSSAMRAHLCGRNGRPCVGVACLGDAFGSVLMRESAMKSARPAWSHGSSKSDDMVASARTNGVSNLLNMKGAVMLCVCCELLVRRVFDSAINEK